MGSLTGNYLILRGDLESKDVVDLMRCTFQFVSDFEGEIPVLQPAIVVTTCSTICLW